MLTEPFEYHDQARSPASYLALAAAIASAYLVYNLDLPQLHRLLAVLFVGIVIWRLTVNPIRGFKLSASGLDCFEGRFHRHVELSEIASVTIYEAKPEGTRCILNLHSGDRLSLPGAERFGARRLIAEFGNHDLPILV